MAKQKTQYFVVTIILVTTTQPVVVYFFRAGVHHSIENAKFWPILAHFDQFCREFMRFLVYFLQVQIIWQCTKIDKYEVCASGGSDLDDYNDDSAWPEHKNMRNLMMKLTSMMVTHSNRLGHVQSLVSLPSK